MSFFFILHESPLQQSALAVSVVAAPSSFIEHESPLQQHESIAQQASAFCF
jgi:hypothetical protein